MLVLVFVRTLQGQPKFKVQYYSAEHGLSHQAVTSIMKDSEGFMWFGTWDGINRFDGRIFVPHKSLPGDNSILGNGRMDQLVEDQAGHIWIQAYDKHIYCFDKKNEQFLPLSPTVDKPGKPKVAFSRIWAATNGFVWLQSEKEGIFCMNQHNFSEKAFLKYEKNAALPYRLPSDTITFFHEDSKHRIWIGTSNGLCLLEKNQSGEYVNIATMPTNIANGMFFTTCEEDDYSLYFGTSKGVLITHIKSTGRFNMHKISDNQINSLVRSKKGNIVYATTITGDVLKVGLNDYTTTVSTYATKEPLNKIFEDRNGLLWIEPEKSGVIRLDPQSNTFKLFAATNDEGLNYIGNRFRIIEDDNDVLWINMKGGGFGYYDTAADSIQDELLTRDAGSYKLPKFVYTIYYDKAGVLWLTTNEREVIKVVSQGNDFKQEFLVSEANSTVKNEVRGFLYDKQNRLWVGAKKGNLYIYQNNQRLEDVIVNEPTEGIGGVYSILQDSHGNIWLGTKGNGLYKASPINPTQTKYQLTHIPISPNDNTGLPCKEVYALLEDANGRIWVGSFDKGLFVGMKEKDSMEFMHASNFYKNYPKESVHKLRHLAMDGKGNIWAGTTNGLLVLEAINNGTASRRNAFYTKMPGDAESLGNNDIQFVLCDSKKRMWLATSGGGLCLAKGQDPFESLRFRNYTVRDGMPNNYVLACTQDNQRNLWLSTENGISKFDAETAVFRNYNSYDGLPKVRFSEAAALLRRLDGQLFFGTNKGFLSFAPTHINENRIDANIALTNLQINNEDSRPSVENQVLQNNINYTTALTLKYNQNIIGIDYAMLDYRAGNSQTFAYRMLGFDTVWHTDRQLGRATYTNLPPGKYVFEVKSLSNDLYVNVPYRRLAITILPPPWKTWWAYLMYSIIACVVFFFMRKYALRMARLRQGIAVERKLAALKLDFFTNVSHELRTPLTLIVGPLDQLLRKEKLSVEGTSYVEVAHKNASRMVRFINQLLDLRKVQSHKTPLNLSPIDLVLFTEKITAHFTEAVRAKQIQLTIEPEQKEMVAWVDGEKLEVVIYNLISNAIKFTPEGKAIKVLLQTVSEDRTVSIKVTDQGPGVSNDKLDHIFELFYGGEESANGGPKGTGIGLSLSKEFVELHGGKIWATNNENGGLTVTVKLKIDMGGRLIAPATNGVEKTKLIEEQVSEHPPLTPQPTIILNDNQQKPLVLLVEDNDELRTFITSQLSEFYRVESAADGEEGFQKTVALMPDLVVSDIMMPKMDGIQMLDKIKNDVNTSHIPVVLLSAKYSIESQINGLSYGADYYITKPFNNEFLVASINNLLRQRKKLFESLVNKGGKVVPDEKEISPAADTTLITAKDEAFLKQVISIVESKMTDANFNIETVAESMAMSRTTFYKKFKSLTGSTIVEFVRDIRLQHAKQLLEAGEKNVSEVAYSTGFSSPNYFSTCFKEKYGVSPSEFVRGRLVK